MVQGRELSEADIKQISGLTGIGLGATAMTFSLWRSRRCGMDRSRFIGTCYRAANWRFLGQTTGRSRQDRDHRIQVPRKDVYVYVLKRRFREVLCR